MPPAQRVEPEPFMPLLPSSFEDAFDDAPVQLPRIDADERQPELVERIMTGLRGHARIVVGVSTDRERQRIVAAGRVAGKRLKRAVQTLDADGGVLVEFDDADDYFGGPPPEAARTPRTAARPGGGDRDGSPAAPRPDAPPAGRDAGEAEAGALPKRVPGAGPRPGGRTPRRP